MKVLLINTSERIGGAAVACNRLMKALQFSGVEAKMLVRDKQTDDNNVISVNDSWFACKINRFRFLWERFVIWWTNCFTRKNLFAVSIANTGIDISRRPEVREADIIHLHWVNQGFLSLKDIEKLTKLGKPIVWTMHDMWPCTSICHHSRDCIRFQEQCKNCPFLQRPSSHDLSFKVFKHKSLIEYDKIAFVTCSHWLEVKAGQSDLLKESKLISIPNPLDVSVFYPKDVIGVKEKNHFSLDKYYVLFGATKINDPRKGFEYYFKALELLSREFPELNDKLELIFLGSSNLQLPVTIPYKVNFMGYLTDITETVDLYNAVDLFVTSSLEENLPNMIMESMACGTPVVGFNVGGVPEMIDHKINGYIAAYKDYQDLMSGILWVLENLNKKDLKGAARKKVMENYSERSVADRYFKLYQELSKNKKIS